MPPMTEQQHKIVKRVHERITTFPESHDQGYWYWTDVNEGDEVIDALMPQQTTYSPADVAGASSEIVVDVAEMVKCGTTACLAGHAVLAAIELGIPLPNDAEHVWEAAVPLLGVANAHGETLGGMFGADDETARAWVAVAAETGSWDHVR